jgi:hypothetical protein
MMVRRRTEVSGEKMVMIIVLHCEAVLGSTFHFSAVPLAATSTSAATTSASAAVFEWCAVLGGLYNPFPLFSLFTLIPYFFSFPFFRAQRRGDFVGANAVRPPAIIVPPAIIIPPAIIVPPVFWGFGAIFGDLGACDAPLRVLGVVLGIWVFWGGFGGIWMPAVRPYGFWEVSGKIRRGELRSLMMVIDKYLSKINYTYLTTSCLLPLAYLH